jgi:hypothetical protein
MVPMLYQREDLRRWEEEGVRCDALKRREERSRSER